MRFVSIAVAIALFAHGFAHVVGFVGPWRLSTKIPYKTTILAGRAELGDVGIKIVGVLWLLLALDFALLAWGAAGRSAWWEKGTLITAGGSLLLCLVDWPDARIGALVNTAIIAILLALRAR